MAKKIWAVRIEGEGIERTCSVLLNTPCGMREVEIGSELEALLNELQREHDRYSQREYRHELRLELMSAAKIPTSVFGKSPEDLLMERYESAQLMKALMRISAVQRKRFILKYDYGLPTSEIAELDGCSTRAVERSLTIARRKLRKLLEG